MAQPDPAPTGAPRVPDADPQVLRAALGPQHRRDFDAEWDRVLEDAKRSHSLEAIHALLRKWQHTAAMELREPGAAQRLAAKAAEIRAAGGNPAGRSVEEMRALIAARQVS
ncbi:DUF6247 family protein [Nocardia sp. NPDC057227]|uniref:DUF6247 family protein n=1 Tax=Nocardia sp. NPDC057227 TaxID=3346056 RepID=UPI003644CC38